MRLALRLVFPVVLLGIVTGCRPPGSTAPIIKLGVLAPFEGAYRQFGYHLIPAARLAVQQAQAAGRLRGVRIEWVVLDTHGDPAMAAQRARELVVDPDVVAVIGPALPETVAAAQPVLAAAGLPNWPFVPAGLPSVDAIDSRPLLRSAAQAALAAAATRPAPWFYVDAAPADATFAAAYTALTGTAPWPLDAAAYRATRAALAALPCRGGAGCTAEWKPRLALYQGGPGHFPGDLVRLLSP
ncbi:MAG: ABC transporter substrate-binding protein [Ardenticatenaceae bacterium]|nr:ABC transporter substrate-binding protein [Ardenticatenaceae bacterium]